MAKLLSPKKEAVSKALSNQNASSKIAPKANSPKKDSSPREETGLHRLFTDGIKDIYWAENHLVQALPKMSRSAMSGELQKAIDNHLTVTKKHVKRLNQIFELMSKKPQAKKCDAMEGLSKEGEGIIENTDTGTLARDLGIIMASQKVEHYEIATYSALSNLAKNLGLNEISEILEKTLAEEKESDEILASIAENLLAKNKSGS